MKLKLWIWVCLLPCTILAQNNSKFEISYEKITLDATHQQSNDKNIAGYFDSIKKINDGMMGVTIGYCNSTLENFRPESPLSNFLTDALLSFSDSVARAHHQKPVDFSLLNFGGIRGSLKQGPITVGNIYNILFDNKIVISSIQGSEVIKLIKKFGDKSCPAYSNIRIVYYNNKPISYTIGDQPIEEDHISPARRIWGYRDAWSGAMPVRISLPLGGRGDGSAVLQVRVLYKPAALRNLAVNHSRSVGGARISASSRKAAKYSWACKVEHWNS